MSFVVGSKLLPSKAVAPGSGWNVEDYDRKLKEFRNVESSALLLGLYQKKDNGRSGCGVVSKAQYRESGSQSAELQYHLKVSMTIATEIVCRQKTNC